MKADAEAARYAQLKEAWMALDALTDKERAQHIARLETTDPELAGALRRRLSSSRSLSDLFDRVDAGAGVDRSNQPPRLAQYQLLRELGRGGMGRVWLAQRNLDDARQLVALKQIGHAHWDDDDLRRFQRERRILAALDHPNVAALIDGGRDESGAPYLATTYVDGVHLDRWCREQALPVRERVRLLREVAAAIAHAHRRLVVHRDLKPANILVTAEGVPKLLDFGIARLVGEEAITTTGPSMMTLRYAAPEQVLSDGAEAGTPVDIYALGVLLYELITDASPYGQISTTAAMLRAILEQTPPAPTRVGRATADADLDAICLKALRKLPEERYQSADALVADLDRWLQREPVDARRGEHGYRLRALLRRHWPALLASALVLASGVGFLIYHLQRIDRQLAETERERDKARAIAGYFSELFQSATPNETRGAELTARELLQRSVERLREGDTQNLDDDARASMYYTAGKVMHDQGLFDEAGELFDRAIALWTALPAPHEDDLADALHERGRIEFKRGKFDKSFGFQQQAMARRKAMGDDGSYVLGVLMQTASVDLRMLGRQAESLDYLERATRILGGHLPLSRNNYATALANLGTMQCIGGEAEKGHGNLAEAVRQLQELKPERTAGLLSIQRNLAMSLRELGRFDEAESVYQKNLERLRSFYGNEHIEVARSLHSYAQMLLLQRRWDDALASLDEAERIEQVAGGADNSRLHSLAADRARIKIARGDFAAAVTTLEAIAAGRGDARAGERANLGAEKAALSHARCRIAAAPEHSTGLRDAIAMMDNDPPLPRALMAQARAWLAECESR